MSQTPENFDDDLDLDLDDDLDDEFTEADLHGMRSALTRYRFFAYITGVLLVLLVCVAVPMKYFWHDDRGVSWTGLPHGWLYMGLLITAVDLGRRVRWSWTRLLLIALAGTVPFLSFVAEYSARKDVLAKIDAWERELQN